MKHKKKDENTVTIQRDLGRKELWQMIGVLDFAYQSGTYPGEHVGKEVLAELRQVRAELGWEGSVEEVVSPNED